MSQTHEQRLTALESEAFRNNRRFSDVGGQVALLRGAVNEQILAVVTPATPEVVRQHVGTPTG
ncbi:hypothetical protein [Catellatospora chokoriensis]|uniref:Uncharacterized protein n=1 Tax=Catellatospora chokoriensis TaxID=310353 RepID=A0A8J3K8P6_9ACTN|nr:hypothetical protein [Catellatospora chokoriensis]GIF92223.1 hypothetical protein Cch02nite_56670 [Catellatospora chokoriensis]